MYVCTYLLYMHTCMSRVFHAELVPLMLLLPGISHLVAPDVFCMGWLGFRQHIYTRRLCLPTIIFFW